MIGRDLTHTSKLETSPRVNFEVDKDNPQILLGLEPTTYWNTPSYYAR